MRSDYLLHMQRAKETKKKQKQKITQNEMQWSEPRVRRERCDKPRERSWGRKRRKKDRQTNRERERDR